MALQHLAPAPRTRTAPRPERVRPTGLVPVLVVGAVAALLRLPFLASPVSSDEAGFSMLARDWGVGTGGLYGRFWVDRPPLLLEWFRFADVLGGSTHDLVALRLLGALAVAATVVGVGVAAREIAGGRAALGGALVCAALLISPAAGAIAVNGELVAAPLLAWGFVAVIRAVRGSGTAAFGAGALAAAAVLVKQNMLDVAVLAALLGLVSLRAGELGRADLVRLAGRFLAAAAGTVVLVLGLGALVGTSPSGVLWAMYPFRLEAMRVIHDSWAMRVDRLAGLGRVWLWTGGPVVVGALAVVVRCRRSTMALAVCGLLVFDVLSVAAGGSYWWHYLVQLAPATGLAAACVLGAYPRAGRRLVALLCVLAAIPWAGGLLADGDANGSVVGQAVGSVAAPGDGIVSLMGAPEVVVASGLPTRYEYPWSMPARTLDPDLVGLDRLLAGPDAPTWVVVRNVATERFLLAHQAGLTLSARYRYAATLCGRTVYVRADQQRQRPVLAPGDDCRRPLVPLLHHRKNGAVS